MAVLINQIDVDWNASAMAIGHEAMEQWKEKCV
jgi:hypothetical protein